ncbi:MAG TPA: hypothetical protein VHL10_00830 [Nitrososphaera sp.]|nr:hypothetical protein [Nitrososphaera sp.]
MTAVVAASLDQSIQISRRAPVSDGAGHTSDGTPQSVGTFAINSFAPSGSQLQEYAGIIGSQKAMMIRFLATSDIREGDYGFYDGLTWTVQRILYAESYAFCRKALITTVKHA